MKHPQDRSPATPRSSSFANGEASAQIAEPATFSDIARARDAAQTRVAAQATGAPSLPHQTEAPFEKDTASVGVGPIERVMLGAIRFYQTRISPRTPPACRFQPTCSEYARLAILRYGGFKGVWLGACRIARCHPLHPGGIDPVP